MGSSNINFESHDASVEDWSSYVERLKSYFVVNGIEDKMKVPAILSLMGATTYKLLKNLATPNIPSELTYQDIVKLLSEHLNPKPLEMTERFRFYKRKQFDGESIANYCAELQKLSIHCNFGNNLSTMLRDKLVMGLKNENIQKKLLAEDKLTYKKAKSIAFAIESAQRDVCEIQNQMVSIKKLHSSQDKTIKKFFLNLRNLNLQRSLINLGNVRCDSIQHLAHECKHKNTQCRNCLKNGHLAKVCHSKRNETVKEIESCSETVPVNSVKSPRHARDKILLEIFVEGNKCLFELDTGAAISCMNVNEFKKLCPDVAIKPTKLLLRNFDNSMITSAGQAVVQIQYKDQINTEIIYLVHAKVNAVFGREWLRNFQLDWSSIIAVRVENCNSRTNELNILLQKPVPFALKERIETELNRLVAEDIIEPMTYSDWATPIVPVIKQNGNLRICGDYKVTINPGLKN
ncbi:polyprotein [Trichonephila clavipes]|uniref:Polyprotein n=1 Tax=Trichonephila clavipes TaxID=2585209 RepID=A0A8X6WIR2_TRICX|nr:polyprotein [Trichonephila clavipes]